MSKTDYNGKNVGFNGSASGILKIIDNPSAIELVVKGDVVMLPQKEGGADSLLPIYKTIKLGAVGIIRDSGKVDHGSIASKELGVPCVLMSSDFNKLKKHVGKIITINNEKIILGKHDQKQRKLPSNNKTTRSKVKINLGFPEIIQKYPLLAEQSDGVAFARLEFIMLDILQNTHPFSYINNYGEEKLSIEIAAKLKPILEQFQKHNKEVWIRTDDLSPELLIELKDGNKYEKREANTNTGWRGIRRSIKQPEMILPQFKAIQKLVDAGYTNIGLFPPMTYSHKEYMEWKRLAETVLDVKKIKLGLMVETPAAALTIEDFVQDIQFVVFGSNDLTQFTLAIDRNNPHLIEMFNEKEKAVLKLMKMVIDVCNRYNIETTIGGQAGSDEEMVDTLLSYGISGVSVNPDPWTVDRVRRFIESKES